MKLDEALRLILPLREDSRLTRKERLALRMVLATLDTTIFHLYVEDHKQEIPKG